MSLGHASRERLLALAEAGPGPIDDAHVAGCERCRREVAALRGTLQEMRAAEVPEPSPLFWERFPERVRAALEETEAAGHWSPARGRLTWRGGRGWLLGGASAVAVVLAVAAGRWSATRAPGPATPAPGAVAQAPTDAGVPAAWAALVGVAELVESDEAFDGASAAGPGAAERAVAALSTEEQRALAALLAAELASQGS